MALKKSITTDSGMVLPNAYHRIQSIRLMRNIDSNGTTNGIASVDVHIYKDAAARSQGLSRVNRYDFRMESEFDTYYDPSVLDGSNVNAISQTYKYMRTKADLNGIDYTDSTNV